MDSFQFRFSPATKFFPLILPVSGVSDENPWCLSANSTEAPLVPSTFHHNLAYFKALLVDPQISFQDSDGQKPSVPKFVGTVGAGRVVFFTQKESKNENSSNNNNNNTHTTMLPVSLVEAQEDRPSSPRSTCVFPGLTSSPLTSLTSCFGFGVSGFFIISSRFGIGIGGC